MAYVQFSGQAGLGPNDSTQILCHCLCFTRKLWPVPKRGLAKCCLDRVICDASRFVRTFSHQNIEGVYSSGIGARPLKRRPLTRQIDVLTFGFWPLRGDRNTCPSHYSGSRAERMSAIELAIRAESKKFLSSPLVVQVLENIWSGKIVLPILNAD
jgi:hypothetical protein